MNKKGFTLIEMLVVIAIIAVLVAIIIPTVSSATDKAAAATNAANLRSFKAELTTAALSGPVTQGTGEAANTWTDASGNTITAPKSKACGALVKDVDATAVQDGNSFTVYFGAEANDIEAFAAVAESGDSTAIAAKPAG